MQYPIDQQLALVGSGRPRQLACNGSIIYSIRLLQVIKERQKPQEPPQILVKVSSIAVTASLLNEQYHGMVHE